MSTRRCTLLLSLSLAACVPPPSEDPGSLVDLRMTSSVGVLLDELPPAERERAAAALLAESDEFWRQRAMLQVDTTYYKLTFRNFFYDDVGPLPLPPREQWVIELGTPERRMIGTHDVVAVDYTFTSTLLSGPEQPGLADPLLEAIGGVIDEPFVLPVDPELLLERTGYACMDEEDFPPNSVDTENARAFYDDTCEAGLEGCHVTEDPGVSCVDAITANVGAIETTMHIEHVAWDAARADAIRMRELSPGGPQLRAVQEGVEDHRVVYRYYPADSCAIAEGCIGGPGWRRLLQFTATMHNQGDEDVFLGDVGLTSPIVENNMVSLSACHGHMHFNHYGTFTFGDGEQALGSKRAFCLESTTRYSNTENSPLVHPYGCHYQGTAAGWGDDYIAGLDCQWVDVTPVVGPISAPLGFHVNPDDFLCEGTLQRDAAGEPTFEPTAFTNEQGEIENRFVCEQREGHADDNMVSTTIDLPAEGGLLTEACARHQHGDKRNCSLPKRDDANACTPGETVTLTCSVAAGDPAQVLRVCETSSVLGHGIPCMFRDALANATIGETPVELAFTCPGARDDQEPGGSYSTYAGPVLLDDASVMITCM